MISSLKTAFCSCKNYTITHFSTKIYDSESFDATLAELKAPITWKYIETPLDENTVRMAKGTDGICIFVNDKANKKVLETMKEMGMKLLVLRAAGFNNVDLPAAKALGIAVVRVPAYSPYAVAEQAMAIELALNRKIHLAFQRTRIGNFSIAGFTGFDLNGKTVGVMGTGKIGTAFARICTGFGMTLLGYDEYKNENFIKLGGKYVTKDEIYA